MGMADDDKFHVLAVADSLIDRKVIERLLKTSSFQVTTVDSGSKALEFLGWQHQHDSNETSSSVSPIIPPQQVQVNLVITDYCMPGMTGYDLLKKMKESSLLKDIPVVIMSSENVPSRITRCLEEGAEEFFLKPVRSSDVNKLRPYIIKTKIKKQDIEKPEKQEIIIESEEIDEYQKKAAAESLQQQEQNNNTKRKSMDEGLSPDRTRPRYTSTVMSN